MPVKKKIVEEEVITEMPTEAVSAEPVVTAPEVVVEPEPVVAAPSPIVTSSEPAKKEGSWWMLLVAFVLGLLVGAVVMYLIKALPAGRQVSVQKEMASPIPSATPVSEIKRSDLKVQVLNGSGVAGAAAKAKTFLEGLGYVDVAAGNADGDFAQTEIELREAKSSASEMIKKDLETNYTLADTIGTLDSSSDYDVVITVGAE
ncbi:MAG: LytR C-terminal domain-containing protein [Patescibacteria group bacterium]